MKGSIVSQDDQLALYPDGQRLSSMVDELGRLVDAQRTRLDLLEEEATHFRTSYNNINKEYLRIKD